MQTVTLELAALMDRAKQLLGVNDNSHSIALSRGYRPPHVSPSGKVGESKALLARDEPPPQSGDLNVRPPPARL